MKIPELTLVADGGLKVSLTPSKSVHSIGRFFVHREFGLPDPTISRNHCQIRWKGRNFWIRDGSEEGVNSLVGTFLDNRRLPSDQWEPLPQQASLRIGATTLSLQYQTPYSNDFDIMISYSRKDEKTVLEIFNHMQDLGLRPWMDQKKNRPATHYKDDIERTIAEVNAVIVFWGGDCMGKTQKAEVEIVTQLHIQERIQSIFLVVLPGSEDPGWSLFLGNIDYYDLRKAGELDRLLSNLETLLPEDD